MQSTDTDQGADRPVKDAKQELHIRFQRGDNMPPEQVLDRVKLRLAASRGIA